MFAKRLHVGASGYGREPLYREQLHCIACINWVQDQLCPSTKRSSHLQPCYSAQCLPPQPSSSCSPAAACWSSPVQCLHLIKTPWFRVRLAVPIIPLCSMCINCNTTAQFLCYSGLGCTGGYLGLWSSLQDCCYTNSGQSIKPSDDACRNCTSA